MDFKAIGQRIKSKRKNMGLTQESLAEKLDISVEYLSRVESGSANASFSLLEKISDAMGISEEELLFGRIPPELDEFFARFDGRVALNKRGMEVMNGILVRILEL